MGLWGSGTESVPGIGSSVVPHTYDKSKLKKVKPSPNISQEGTQLKLLDWLRNPSINLT